ncbi:MAG: hypothetical protein RLZZ214_2365 [Verrucomicrobiota bacterium]|jgi:hypothetical protein
MSATRSPSRAGSSGVNTCPACGGPVKADSNWCPGCNFTGGDTVAMFPDHPPPFLPILDAAGILKPHAVRKIEAARDSLRRRFPQFQWRICTVILPPETRLSVFGFWLLNACPLDENETPEDRAATILLLINADSGQAAVIPGYAAESCLSDDGWKDILATMAGPWRAGDPTEAIIRFFKSTRSRLELAWTSYGIRKPARISS